MSAQLRLFVFCLITICLTAAGFAMAADEEESYFEVITLAPDMFLLCTDQGSYSNNSLVFTGPDGVLLVDTHHDSDEEEFKKFIDELGFGDPKYIICTHRHVEHMGANGSFGADPIMISHHLLPEKLSSGTFLFNEYPPEAYPDIMVTDSLEIKFNGETIRLTDVGGSHDDNEILVHFVNHGIAHCSSVVNGFNFPSVDSDGDVLKFEPVVRQLMTLLPKDIKIISGHHGKVGGFDFVGTWDMLEPYAEMMKETIEIGRKEVAAGKTEEEMKEADIFKKFEKYSGSYVSHTDWVGYIVDVLTVPKETRADICKPIFATWKKDGPKAAVKQYQELLASKEDQYDFSEYLLMSIGGKLYTKGKYEDSVEFLLGSREVYPESQYAYYDHYLIARGYQKLSRLDKAEEHCRESLQLNADFAGASGLMEELSGESEK